jgi:hypothetical protein
MHHRLPPSRACLVWPNFREPMSPVSHLRLAPTGEPASGSPSSERYLCLAGLDGRLATSIANRSKRDSADEANRGISTVAASPRRPLTDVPSSYAPLGECPLDRPNGMPLSRTPSDLRHSHVGFSCGHGAEEVGLQLRLVAVEAYARSPLEVNVAFVVGDRINISNRSGQPVTMPTMGWFRWPPCRRWAC